MRKSLLLIIALCGCAVAQTPYAFFPNPRIQFVDSNGVPLAGGFLFSYNAGTSVPAATYHLDTLGNITPNANPVILDSTGSAEVRLLPQAYKFVLQNSSSTQVWSVDQVEDVGQILYGQAVLLNPVGAALQTIAGPLAVTTITVGGGTPLANSNQSGTGILCMTVNCQETTPTINGATIQNSPGAYIVVPNSSSVGTTLNTLTKFTPAVPLWVKHNDKNGAGSGSPQTASAFASPLTNLSLIVVLATGPVGTFTISDTAGNTYTDCGPGQLLFNSSANGIQCFYTVNTHTTTANVVSFANTGGGAMKLTATEWTGNVASSPVDITQNSGNNASSGSGGGQNVSSGATLTTAADLIVGMAGVTAGALTAGTGFTASSTNSLEYLTQGSPANLAATWNDNTNTDSYAAMMIAFRPASGASSTASIISTTDTSTIGVAVLGAGTTGNVVIQQSGSVPCQFDGPTTAGDVALISTTVSGDCHDSGTSLVTPKSIGQVMSTNGVSGVYSMDFLPSTSSGAFLSGTLNLGSATINATSCSSLITAAPGATSGEVVSFAYLNIGSISASDIKLVITPQVVPNAISFIICNLTAGNLTQSGNAVIAWRLIP